MVPVNKEKFLENARRIQDEIAGINPEARLVIVTKAQLEEVIGPLYSAGYRDFGENRTEGFLPRQAAFPRANWHFIGRLHRKYVAKVVGKAAYIHSVASSELLEKIERSAAAAGVVQKVLLQVNVSGEEQKQGLYPEQLRKYVKTIDFEGFPHVRVEGLMTMAPFTSDETVLRDCFSGLRKLRDELNESFGLGWHELSMGMTNDYRLALLEGATIVRIGRAVFE